MGAGQADVEVAVLPTHRRRADAYEIRAWTGACPEDLVEPYVETRQVVQDRQVQVRD